MQIISQELYITIQYILSNHHFIQFVSKSKNEFHLFVITTSLSFGTLDLHLNPRIQKPETYLELGFLRGWYNQGGITYDTWVVVKINFRGMVLHVMGDGNYKFQGGSNINPVCQCIKLRQLIYFSKRKTIQGVEVLSQVCMNACLILSSQNNAMQYIIIGTNTTQQ